MRQSVYHFKTPKRPRSGSTDKTHPPISLNLTIRFLPSSSDSDSTCAYSNSTNALTFTTQNIPAQSHCFNFADLFGGNATSGFVNQTSNKWQELGIHWALENADEFDAQTNYSNILYRQAAHGQEAGSYATTRVNLYGGLDCTERDPNDDKGLLDWYGLNCQTGVEGECGALPYSIASFTVMPVSGDDGTCLMYAQLGAGVGIHQPIKAVASAFVGAVVAGWLAL